MVIIKVQLAVELAGDGDIVTELVAEIHRLLPGHSVVHSHWSRNVEARVSLVRVLLRQ